MSSFILYVLEDACSLLLVNAARMANVPGRKTDVQDCAWSAQRLECGLLRGSFVPPPAIRDLRDLTRDRKALLQNRTREANRLHTVLEDAGVQLATVASDLLAVSGRARLTALVAGTTDPPAVADPSPAASSGRSSRPSGRPSPSVSGATTPFSSPNSSRTWTTSRRPSPR